MNRFLIPSLTLLIFGGLSSAAEDPTGTLTFGDQASLTATPLAVDGEKKTIRLKSPSLEGEVTLKTDQLVELTLDGEAPKLAETDHYAIATIKPRYQQRPQDSIRGRLVDLADETISLETDYAGTLILKRSMVQSLDIYGQLPTFYNGPNGPDGWVYSMDDAEDHWEFHKRTMISRARTGIARKVNLPERAKISFKIDWKSSPRFSFIFLSDDGESNNPDEGYTLQMRQTWITLNREGVDDELDSTVFNKTINSLRKKTSTNVTVYLDRRKEGTSAIYFDQELINTWTGTDDSTMKGQWMHFIPQQVNPLRFSKISVTQWDGNLPLKKDDEKDAKNTFEDDLEGQEINLINGDTVIGEIKSIKDGIVMLATSFGDALVPIGNMNSIALSSVEDAPRMYGGDVRAWFHEGGFVTLRLSSMNQKSIKGYSQVFGDAEFQLNAFARIEFNIWDKKLDPALYSPDRDWSIPLNRGMEPPQKVRFKRKW